jgi:hypothetical protein
MQGPAEAQMPSGNSSTACIAAFDAVVLECFNVWPDSNQCALDVADAVNAAFTAFVGTLWQLSILRKAHYASLNDSIAALSGIVDSIVNDELRTLQVGVSIHRALLRRTSGSPLPVQSDFLRQSLLAVRGLAEFPDQQTPVPDSSVVQTVD